MQTFLSSALGLIAVAALLLALALAFSAAGRARQGVGMQPLATPAHPTSIPTLVPVPPTAIPPTPVPALVPVDVAKVSVTLERFGWWDTCMPYFAPDGDRYLCMKDDGILIVSLSRGLEGLVNKGPSIPFPIRIPQWSPDGKHVAIVSSTYEPGKAVEAPIFVIDTKAGQVTQEGVTDIERAVHFTARGQLAFSRNRRLHLLNLAMRAEREFSGKDLNVADYFADFRVSPDGQKIALFEGGVISIVDLNTQQVVFTVSGIGATTSPWRLMAWSSDSRKLAYTILGEGKSPELWVVDADGGNPQRLWSAAPRRGSCQFLEWLPGRNAILFIHSTGGSPAAKWNSYQIISGDGGPAKELFTNGEGLFLGGNRFSFGREFADDPNDTGIWVATLSY